jgi:hypothetical protein
MHYKLKYLYILITSPKPIIKLYHLKKIDVYILRLKNPLLMLIAFFNVYKMMKIHHKKSFGYIVNIYL